MRIFSTNEQCLLIILNSKKDGTEPFEPLIHNKSEVDAFCLFVLFFFFII